MPSNMTRQQEVELRTLDVATASGSGTLQPYGVTASGTVSGNVSGTDTPAPLLPDESAPGSPAGGDGQEFSLPPVDGGKDAWLFLIACFAIEALVWGMFCFRSRSLRES